MTCKQWLVSTGETSLLASVKFPTDTRLIDSDGQKRPVFIYRLVTCGTIDEKIFQRQITKIGLSDCGYFNTFRGLSETYQMCTL